MQTTRLPAPPLLSHITGARFPVPDPASQLDWGEGSVLFSTAGWIEAIQPPDSPTPSMPSFDATGCTLLPGFIDLHIHGCDGHDVMDATPAALVAMSRFLARHGVTGFYPTTMTAPPAPTLAAVQAVAAVNGDALPGARILGIHLEGPYLSPQFPGAQPREFVRDPDLAEFAALINAGPVKLITLAPEQAGAQPLIEMALAHNIAVVIGHSAASYEQTIEAVSWGISQATHTYNAMTGLHHRKPGVVGAVLSQDTLFAQLIADNIHVHPAAMKVLARCKGADRTLLITDAIRATGLPAGDYELGGQPVRVHNGECRLADGTLAGSILTADRGFEKFSGGNGMVVGPGLAGHQPRPSQRVGVGRRTGNRCPWLSRRSCVIRCSAGGCGNGRGGSFGL